MDIYSLVFSNNRNYRLTRHAIFWLMWITYYAIFDVIHFKTTFPLSQRILGSFTEVTLSTPMDMAFCYSIIYFLLPNFLLKGRYISMILLWILFSVLFITLYETYVLTIIPFMRGWYGLSPPMKPVSYYYVFFSLFGQINMEGCLAAAIKLGKLAFIKQKEVDLLRDEKNRLPAEMDKNEMQSVFLVDIIGRVEQIAKHKAAAVPGMIKKIRNLMTYIIYENRKTKVDLKRELELIKEYVELEKVTRDDVIDVSLFISGYYGTEKIASFILFPCIQNAFKQVSVLNVENKKITIDININNSILDLRISWNKPLDTSTLAEGKNIILQNLSKRLSLIYPQSHEMKVVITVDEIIVTLNIDLKTAVN
jgi:hypothetical protein